MYIEPDNLDYDSDFNEIREKELYHEKEVPKIKKNKTKENKDDIFIERFPDESFNELINKFNGTR